MATWRERLAGKGSERQEAGGQSLETVEAVEETTAARSVALVSLPLGRLQTCSTEAGNTPSERLRALAGELAETALTVGGGELTPALRAMLPSFVKLGESRLARLSDSEAVAGGLAFLILGARVIGDPELSAAVVAYSERVAEEEGVPLISAPGGAVFGEVYAVEYVAPPEEAPEGLGHAR